MRIRGSGVRRVADRDGERVGRVVGLRRLREPEQGPHHALDLLLGRRPGAADRHLHGLRRVVEARDAALGGGEERDAPRLSHADRRAHVLAEVDVLEGECGRLMPGR